MPTNILSVQSFTPEKSVFLSYTEKFRLASTLDVSKVSASPSTLSKIAQSGDIIVRQSSGSKTRLLPRAKSTVAVSSGAAITVSNAKVFVAGEALVIPMPYGRVLFGGTFANGDIITTVLDGNTVLHTVANWSNVTALAIAVAATLNANPLFSSKAIAIADAGNMHIYAKNGVSNYAFAITDNGAGTIAVLNSATALATGLSLGTIQSVNADTNVITLDALALRLPLGLPVGLNVAVNYMTVLGILRVPVDLLKDTDDVVAYHSGVINGAAMSYWDDQVALALPEIKVA